MVDPTFTTDWSASRVHWPELFRPLVALNRRLRVLEIGCYEGQGTLEFIRILGDVVVYCVDPFDADRHQLDRFLANTRHVNDRCFALRGRSQTYAQTSWAELFDLVYVDGSHDAHDVLADAVNAYVVTRPGGWILFDDYNHAETPGVFRAVNAFVECYGPLFGTKTVVGPDQYLVVKT